MHGLLNARGDQVHLSKVKGHATPNDVAQGRVSERDKIGNDAADGLASAAAEANSLPRHVVRNTLHRKKVARAVQLMMIDILTARSQTLANLGTDNVHASCSHDSGSSSTEGSTPNDSESSYSQPCSSSVQQSVALHSGSDQPT